MSRLLWIAPEAKGGIRSYTEALWPAVKRIWEGEALDPRYYLPQRAELEALRPDVIHVQHEFGLFGSKIPGLYRFPSWLKEARRALPHAKIYATAHTVLDENYRYPVQGRGWQIPLRQFANQALVPLWRGSWIQGTWGRLDGVIAHSGLQIPTLRLSGCPKVAEIPHFVFDRKDLVPAPREDLPVILVVGYITPEKGQDIAIRALAEMRTRCRLVLAGGLRRDADRSYLDHCQRVVATLGLSSRVEITGYLLELDSQFARADLVLTPFRETSGSGTIAQAFARGMAVVASDLPLNQEILSRQKNCLALFRSEDATDCAHRLDDLLARPQVIDELKQGALLYGDAHNLSRTAQKHREFYG